MKITYTVSIEDVYALNDYLMSNSAAMKKMLRKNQIMMAVSPIIGVLALVYIKDIPFKPALVIAGIIGIIIGLPLFFLYPKYFKMNYRRTVKQLYAEGQNKGVVGEHEITIVNESMSSF